MSLFKRPLCNLQILRAFLATYDFILLYADSVNNAMFHVFLDPIKAFKHQALLHIEKGSKETLKMSWTADSYIFLFFLFLSEFFQKSISVNPTILANPGSCRQN